MGLSEQWVAVRIGAPEIAVALADELSEMGLRVLSEHGGWLWAHGWPERVSLDDLVTRIAARSHEPVIGAWVFDSDFGYIVGASDRGWVAFRLAVNPAYDEGDEDDDAEMLRRLWAESSKRREAAEQLAAWSAEYAPRAVSATDVLSMLPIDDAAAPTREDALHIGVDAWSEADDGTQQWLFAEDGMRLVYDRLGFPNLDDAVFGPAGETPEDGAAVDRLYITVPDIKSMMSLYARLAPSFEERIVVTVDRGRGEAAFPDTRPSLAPEWLDDVVADISQWLADTGIDRLRTPGCSRVVRLGDPQSTPLVERFVRELRLAGLGGGGLAPCCEATAGGLATPPYWPQPASRTTVRAPPSWLELANDSA